MFRLLRWIWRLFGGGEPERDHLRIDWTFVQDSERLYQIVDHGEPGRKLYWDARLLEVFQDEQGLVAAAMPQMADANGRVTVWVRQRRLASGGELGPSEWSSMIKPGYYINLATTVGDADRRLQLAAEQFADAVIDALQNG